MRLKLFASVLFSCLLLSANAQFRSIPADVTDSFKMKYPKAMHVTWKDKISSFQAEFELNKKPVKASYSSKGAWQKTEKKVDLEKLPADVKDGFSKSKFAAYEVMDVTEIDDSSKGLQYKVVVKKGDITKRSLYFTTAGQLIKDEVNF